MSPATDQEPRAPEARSPEPLRELLRPDGGRWDFASLLHAASDRDRLRVMQHAVAPELSSISGFEFAGANTLRLTRLIGIRKFIKGFYDGPARTPSGPEPYVQGYNIAVRQNGDLEPHLDKPSAERPRRHGFYRVHRVVPGARDALHPNALLLDYSLGGNPWYDPARLLRDYVVQVYADDPDLLLGRALGAVFGLRIAVSYFVLRRLRAHDFRG